MPQIISEVFGGTMSTRCNIIIGDQWKLYIYRHSDGYPSSIIPDLRKFMKWVKEQTNETARFNTPQQFAGWLIVWGYLDHREWLKELKDGLVDKDGKGIFYTKTGFPFVLSWEVSLVYTQERGRRISGIHSQSA